MAIHKEIVHDDNDDEEIVNDDSDDKEIVNDAYYYAHVIDDDNDDTDDIDQKYEKKYQKIRSNGLTTKNKSKVIKRLKMSLDRKKVREKKGRRRDCENCKQKCYATSYCENCIRNYLKAKFSEWTSGSDEIDNLIKKCQMKLTTPYKIIEWIPYNNLKDINYLTKGGCSEIYKAVWIDGCYKWDSRKQQLERSGKHKVVLKRLVDIAKRSWFDEAKDHLKLSNKYNAICQSFGLTQHPLNKDYFIVMKFMNMDLKEYLKQNHSKLTWKKRNYIICKIVEAICKIHEENKFHKDLHSGNILYLKEFSGWYISDLGFCDSANKPSGNTHGNLPYVAPEVLDEKEYTKASEIYSIGMLMWEISSGKQPFANFARDYDLVMKIKNGMRPEIVSETPLVYRKWMIKCWDNEPLKRPDIDTLLNEIKKMCRDENIQKNSSKNPELKNVNKAKEPEGYDSEDYRHDSGDSGQNNLSIPNFISTELKRIILQY